MLAMSKVYVVN